MTRMKIEPGPILVHRADILDGLKSLYAARPDWHNALRAVAIQTGVVDEFGSFVAVQSAEFDAFREANG